MNNCTLNSLNSILSKSDKYSSVFNNSNNSILKNLAVPNDVFVRKQPHISIIKMELPHKISYNNSNDCIDDKLCSEFIKLIGEDKGASPLKPPLSKKSKTEQSKPKSKKSKPKSKTEQSKTEQSKTEQSKTEQSKPKSKKSKTQKSITKKSKTNTKKSK